MSPLYLSPKKLCRGSWVVDRLRSIVFAPFAQLTCKQPMLIKISILPSPINYKSKMKLYLYRGLENEDEEVPRDITHVIVHKSVTAIKRTMRKKLLHLGRGLIAQYCVYPFRSTDW